MSWLFYQKHVQSIKIINKNKNNKYAANNAIYRFIFDRHKNWAQSHASNTLQPQSTELPGRVFTERENYAALQV